MNGHAMGTQQAAESGQIIAGTVSAKWAKGTGGPSGDEAYNLVAFDTTQVTSKANRSNPKAGDPCHPLAAGAHAPLLAPLLEVGARTNGDGYRDGDGIGEPGDPMYSLQASKQHGVTTAIPRRLTPVECERLQAFPDDWTAYGIREDGTRWDMADGPRYRMMGNAVTVNVVTWLAKRIMEHG